MQSTAARLKERSQAGRSPAALQDATKVRSRCAAPRAASTRVKAARSPAVWWERTTAKSTIRTPMCASMHKAPWAASWEAVPASSSAATALATCPAAAMSAALRAPSAMSIPPSARAASQLTARTVRATRAALPGTWAARSLVRAPILRSKTSTATARTRSRWPAERIIPRRATASSKRSRQ